MATYVALMRGINLGTRRMSMKELTAVIEELGCTNVRTYVQSGNVVYDAPASLAETLPQRLEKAIQRRWGFGVPIVTRTSAELANIVTANPFLKAGADANACYVMFLGDKPAAKQVAALDPDRSPGDAFLVIGREIYLHLPKGAARSKLTNAYFDSALKTVSTGRNWRTVQALAAMTKS